MSDPALRVLYQSSNFLVVDKCFDIVMNDNNPDRDSLTKLVQKNFPELYDKKFAHGFRVLHRLDYSTSGIVVFPLTNESCASACKAFENRHVEKYYLAVARGHFRWSHVRVKLGIGPDVRPEWQRIKMCTELSEFCGKCRKAETQIVVLSRGEFEGEPATKILLKAATGRRHQLRVHCAEIGHTLVGDFTYSNRTDVRPYRMFLHAHRIVIPSEIEALDVNAGDPFLQSENPSLNLYNETEVIRQLDDNVYKTFGDAGINWFTIDNASDIASVISSRN